MSAHSSQNHVGFIAPMLAKSVHRLPEGSNWQYEVKLDGYRTIAAKRTVMCRFFRGAAITRNANILPSHKIPDGTVIDGEAVVLDEHGKADFNRLQNLRPGDPVC